MILWRADPTFILFEKPLIIQILKSMDNYSIYGGLKQGLRNNWILGLAFLCFRTFMKRLPAIVGDFQKNDFWCFRILKSNGHLSIQILEQKNENPISGKKATRVLRKMSPKYSKIF